MKCYLQRSVSSFVNVSRVREKPNEKKKNIIKHLQTPKYLFLVLVSRESQTLGWLVESHQGNCETQVEAQEHSRQDEVRLRQV